MYSSSCCSCSFELEIIKIGLSSHKMYSNNILNFQESTAILNACTKKSENFLNAPRIYIYECLQSQKKSTDHQDVSDQRKIGPNYILLIKGTAEEE